MEKIIYVDDLDGTEGAQRHTLSIDGDYVEIDLSPANHEQLVDLLAPFTSVAQRVKANGEPARTLHPPRRHKARRRVDMNVTEVPSASPTIRSWWKNQPESAGLPPHRAAGRIPDSVMEAFSLSAIGAGGLQQSLLFQEAKASTALDGETQSLA